MTAPPLRARPLAVCALLLVFGCATPKAQGTGAPDTGTPDTGTPDTNVEDSGTPDTSTADTATPDAGAPFPDTAAPPAPAHPVAPCKLVDPTPGGVSLGFPRAKVRLRSTGVVRAAVLFADFPDAPATGTPKPLADLLSPTVHDFFAAVSYGAMDFQLDVHLSWLRMTKPSSHYAQAIKTYAGHRDWLKEAVAKADPAVDFKDADVVLVIANPAATKIAYGPTWMGVGGANGTISADGAQITNGVTSGKDLLGWGGIWANHELGHSMGLVDLYSFTKPTGYTRPFSLMDLISSSAPEYLAYERWLLGWLDDTQVVCLPKSGQVALAPIEAKGGVKVAMVPLGKSRAVVVESRRALGWDDKLQQPGPIVYTVDAAVASGSGPIRVANGQKALTPGSSVTVEGVTIKLLQSAAAGDHVAIDLP